MNIDRLRDMLIRHEGIRHQAYDDASGRVLQSGMMLKGTPTIGVGRNLLDPGLSDQEIHILLHNDIQRVINELDVHFPVVTQLSEPRQEVLANMLFNLGTTRLKGFRRMWSAISMADYERASHEMLDSRWAQQVGSRATELAKVMLKGAFE